VRGLEETPEGCRWLLDRWNEIRTVMVRNANWFKADLFKLIRLQGKQPFEAVNDPQLNALFLAWDVICPGSAQKVWEDFHEQTPKYDPGFSNSLAWREIADRPADVEAAIVVLESVIIQEIERLEELLAVHEEIAGEEAAELTDRASFDPSASFERLRRYQTAKSRELTQALEAFYGMRKAESERRKEQRKTAGDGPPAEVGPLTRILIEKLASVECKPPGVKPVISQVAPQSMAAAEPCPMETREQVAPEPAESQSQPQPAPLAAAQAIEDVEPVREVETCSSKANFDSTKVKAVTELKANGTVRRRDHLTAYPPWRTVVVAIPRASG
jgi:hypothetical protein